MFIWFFKCHFWFWVTSQSHTWRNVDEFPLGCPREQRGTSRAQGHGERGGCIGSCLTPFWPQFPTSSAGLPASPPLPSFPQYRTHRPSVATTTQIFHWQHRPANPNGAFAHQTSSATPGAPVETTGAHPWLATCGSSVLPTQLP